METATIKKITLANLETSTAQEVFDFIATHLLTQGKKSQQRDRHCVYRTSENLSCAAGCLMDGNEYKIGFEGLSWGELVTYGRVPSAHELMISEFQVLHDSQYPAYWYAGIENIANRYKLHTENIVGVLPVKT